MECQECHKRQAALHYTQVINGQKTEIHVCESCAREKGYMSELEEGYSLHNLLTGLFNIEPSSINGHGNSPFSEQQSKETACPQCGMTFNEFKHAGKFGCAMCYQTFADKLNPIFRKVHSGNSVHRGKIPKRQGGNMHVKKELDDYKAQLKRLIEDESFEEAAVVRDKIRELEKEIRGDHA